MKAPEIHMLNAATISWRKGTCFVCSMMPDGRSSAAGLRWQYSPKERAFSVSLLVCQGPLADLQRLAAKGRRE